MPKWEKMRCSKCGRERRENEFFKLKTGERFDICKSCLTMNIDNRKPETFLWILEKFDVPYVERIWVEMTNETYLRDPAKFGPASVIGKYIRSMNMHQYKDYGFADSDKINNEHKREREIAQQALSQKNLEMLKWQLEQGLITQGEYDLRTDSVDNITTLQTFNDLIIPDEDAANDDEDPQEPTAAQPTDSSSLGFIPDFQEERSRAIESELTDEDIKYLTLKWGTFYKISEMVKMEELFQKYASEYEMNVDREEVLEKLCKVSLKMDNALDMDDFAGYQRLSQTFDQMRKSAKFTEAQNKEEQTRDLDSIGELVNFVEREGGIIPQFENDDEYPQDKIDYTIKDMQRYVTRLVKEELGLGDLIESYIERLEKNKQNSMDDILNEDFRDDAEKAEAEPRQKTFQEIYLEEINPESIRLADGDYL